MKASALRRQRTMLSLREFYDRVLQEPLPNPLRRLLDRLNEND